MLRNSFPEPATKLSERLRGRLRPGPRERYILLFALFNAMFCFLFLLLLQNRQLSDQIETIQATATMEAIGSTQQRQALRILEEQIDTLQGKIEEMLFPSPTPPTTVSTKNPDQGPPTSAPTPTASPTSEPSPTPTPVTPTPTYTLIPPTFTPTPSPVPTPTPKPKPKPNKNKTPPPRPTDDPNKVPPTRPP